MSYPADVVDFGSVVRSKRMRAFKSCKKCCKLQVIAAVIIVGSFEWCRSALTNNRDLQGMKLVDGELNGLLAKGHRMSAVITRYRPL